MNKKAKMRVIKNIFKTMAQGWPPEEQEYIKGLMRSVIGRQRKIKHWGKTL